jgi:hypothetical protein
VYYTADSRLPKKQPALTRRLTFLLASLLLCGGAVAQSQQAIRDQFFGETDAVKKQADELDAKLLAPAAYAEGLELYVSAGETLAKGKDLESVREDLEEANGFFARSVDAAKLAHVTFANALTARAAAQTAESAKYAAREWTRAEESLLAAAETLEGGNLKRAADDAIDTEKAYRETEAKAINAKASAN